VEQICTYFTRFNGSITYHQVYQISYVMLLLNIKWYVQ